jgi:Flp pilus assembly protein TadD
MLKNLIMLLLVAAFGFGQAKLDDIIELVNNGKLDEAETQINAYLEANEEDPGALFVKGLILMKQEKDKEAVAFIEKAIEAQPKEAEYHKLAGLLYEKLNQIQKAKSAWRKCKKLAKDEELRKEAGDHLEMLERK